MPRAEYDRQWSRWQADTTYSLRRRIHRLFRQTVGRELGKALRPRHERSECKPDRAQPVRTGNVPRIKEAALKKLLFALILLCTISTLGLAHHSFAMYDQTKTITLTGRLTRFVLGANHAQLLFELLGPDGKQQLDSN